jgi:hypothetical protein
VGGADDGSGNGGGEDSAGAAGASMFVGDEVDTRRSTADILARKPRAGRQFDRSMPGSAEYDALPGGPFSTLADTVAAFHAFGLETGDRFYKSGGLKKPTKDRGAQQHLKCSYNAIARPSRSTGERQRSMLPLAEQPQRCPFTVMLEESQQGWIVAHAFAQHSDHEKNEPRVLGEAERRASYTKHNSKIPDELLDLVTPDMLLLRLTVRAIKDFIDKKAVDLKYTIDWSYNDVYNHFSASVADRVHDSANLVDALQKRRDEKGLQYKIRLDDEGTLVQAFFEMVRAACATLPRAPPCLPAREGITTSSRTDGLALALTVRFVCATCAFHLPTASRVSPCYAQEGGSDLWSTYANVGQRQGYAESALLFDITFGTNALGLKLGAFTTVGPDGSTRILGATMTLREDAVSFEWAFGAFLETFKYQPTVFLTDGDLAIAAAARAIFTCSHQLCIYHFSLTFGINLAPALGGVNAPAFRTAQSMFWDITLQTDEHTRDDWADEWHKLTSFVLTAAAESTPERIETARKWLEKADERKTRWAYRFTWGTFGAGQNTTGVSYSGRSPSTCHSPPSSCSLTLQPVPAPSSAPLPSALRGARRSTRRSSW